MRRATGTALWGAGEIGTEERAEFKARARQGAATVRLAAVALRPPERCGRSQRATRPAYPSHHIRVTVSESQHPSHHIRVPISESPGVTISAPPCPRQDVRVTSGPRR